MASRWGKELRIRYRGDPALGAQYVPNARKLAGDLIEGMGVAELDLGSRTFTLKDGARITILVPGKDLRPIATIDVTAVKRPPLQRDNEFLLDGFVVRPSSSVNYGTYDEFSHIILKPGDEPEEFKAYFFNESYYDGIVTTDVNHGTYGKAECFPDGISYFGNVDWQNEDGSVVVTFHGPRNRYIGQFTFQWAGFTAYWKGKQLFSVYDMEGDGILDVLDGYVPDDLYLIGAAVREFPFPELIVVLTANVNLTNQDIPFFVIGCKLRTPITAPQQRVVTAPRIEVSEFRLLGKLIREYDADEPYQFQYHPFWFNQSCTEARSIQRFLAYTGAPADFQQISREWLIELTDTTATITFSDEEYTTAERTSVFTDVLGTPGYYPNSVSGAVLPYLIVNDTAGASALGDRIAICLTPTLASGWLYRPEDPADVSYAVTAFTETISEAFASPKIKYAVDYKNDVATYLYGINGAISTIKTYECSGLPDSVADIADVVGIAHVLTTSVSSTSPADGNFETDFLTVEETSEVTSSSLLETNVELDGYSPSPLFSIEGAYEDEEVRALKSVEMWFLDMRHEIAVVNVSTVTTTTAKEATIPNSIPIPTAADWDGSTTTTIVRTNTVTVSKGGVTLATNTFSGPGSSGTVSISSLPVPPGEVELPAVTDTWEVGGTTQLAWASVPDEGFPEPDNTAVSLTAPDVVDEENTSGSISPPDSRFLDDSDATFGWMHTSSTGDSTTRPYREWPIFVTLGSWIRYQDGWAFSMPWPQSSGAEGWLSNSSFGSISAAAGLPSAAERYHPIWPLGKTIIKRRT